MDAFEPWLVRRVAQAVEAGEVPASLLTELQAEIESARERPQEESHAEAVQDIAEKLNIPLERAKHMLATLEAQPSVIREVFMRRIALAWLDGHQEAYRRQNASH